MSELREDLISMGKRALIAAPLFIASQLIFKRAGAMDGDMLAGFGWSMFGFAFLLAGVVVLAIPLAGVLSNVVGGFSTSWSDPGTYTGPG